MSARSPQQELEYVDTLMWNFHGRRWGTVARITLTKLRRSIFERCQAEVPRDAASDLAKPGLVQPLDKALPEQETREGEEWTTVDPSRVSELRDEIETAYDLLTALDKAGDGIGGDLGHGVSAVALAARAALDNARSMLKAMEAGSTLVNASRGSRACVEAA